MEEDKQEKVLSRSQKTGFVLLFVFALLTVALSFLQIRNNIYNPFALQISQADANTIQSLQYDENTKLQQIDTDQDGLNDYEEINFYSTSRYLPDTDSDGFTDKVEITNGTDPLCPEGQQCAQEEFATVDASSTIATPLTSGIETPADILLNSQTTPSSTIDMSGLLTDPAAIRAMLISTGKVTAEDLKGVDDATLLQLAKDSFTSAQSQSNTATAQ